jgi:hypothetical protein
MRPLLNPALARLRRDEDTIQLGTHPARTLVVGGCDEAAATALELIDGTRTPEQIIADASLGGLPRAQGDRLLGILAAAGALVSASSMAASRDDLFDRERLARERRALAHRGGAGPAERLCRRRSRRVTVVGASQVASHLALVLAAAGVGSLRVDDPRLVSGDEIGPGSFDVDDLGLPRSTTLRAHLGRTAPSVGIEHADATADLVVLSDLSDESSNRPPGHDDPAQLAVSVRDGVGIVGPLVVPGRTACLRCLGLTRADRDPAWPRIVAQLHSPQHRRPTCEVALATRLAGLAAQQTLAFLDGDPAVPSYDATLEIDPSDYRVRRRSWRPHPGCGCGAG